MSDLYSFSNLWPVLKLFLIPWGGGIPAGVLAARDHALTWPVTSILYLISDVILACVFEPLLILFIYCSKRSEKMSRMGMAIKEAMRQTLSRYGSGGGAFTLILIAFGADPMTGRSAAVAAGHGFVMGWVFAITGDLFYFGVIMASTLWLNGILGDGTLTTLIVLAGMIGIPWLMRKMKKFS